MPRSVLLGVAGLLAAPLTAQSNDGQGEFPADWFWHSRPEQIAKHAPMIGQPMPALRVTDWMNGAVDLERDLAGKVVVVDFWATWCGPCIASIPENHALWSEHRDDGLVFLGVCGSGRGQERMAEIAAAKDIRYPIAQDVDRASATAWNVLWWPTYGVVDRSGKLRALGLKPERVDDVVRKLLAEPPPETAEPPAEIPADWREDRRGGREVVDALELAPPPPLHLADWIHSDPLELQGLRGKVVLLDFWATWCGPCLAAIPHTNELAEKHPDLVVIGLCHPDGAEKMAEVAKEHGIRYPIARDVDGATAALYRVNSYPDYYLIDRQGRLRVADLANGKVDAAVELLLAEKGPSAEERPREGSGEGPAERPAEGGGEVGKRGSGGR